MTFRDCVLNIPTVGRKIKQNSYLTSGTLPVIDQGHKFIGGYTNDKSARIVVNESVIVFGDHTRIIKFVNFDFAPGADGIKVFKPLSFYDPKYFAYILQAVKLPDKGYSRHYQYLEKSEIPICPLPEQKRIVAKIESLFSRLDSAKDSLECVQQEIKRYRQSALKSAFENIEQEESIEDVFKIIDYRGRTPPYADKGVVHLRTANIRDGQIRLENIRYVTEGIYKKYMTRGLPRKGDVLMTTEAPMGEVSLIPQYKFSIAQRMVLLRSENLDKFVLYQIMSTAFQKKLEKAKTGTTVAGISSRNFKKVKFKLCSLQDQNKIVEIIESRFERAKVLEDVVEQGVKKIAQLKQSILKKAFEGKLVEPDPTDEPVEVLLERIKKEKAKIKVVSESSQKRRK